MKFLKLIPILFIFFGNFPYKNLVHAEINNPQDYKVLSNDNKKLSISNVKYLIEEGDAYIKNGEFDKADLVRDELLQHGIILKDSNGATEWKYK